MLMNAMSIDGFRCHLVRGHLQRSYRKISMMQSDHSLSGKWLNLLELLDIFSFL